MKKVIYIELLKQKALLETTDKWFGVTYPEDKQIVQDSINELIEQGTYPKKLWK